MRLIVTTLGFILCVLISASIVRPTLAQQTAAAGQTSTPTEDKFVYADFERMQNGRAVSNNGGLVQLFAAQESTPVTFKGMADAPNAPELVRAKGDEKNHLATFAYTLVGPNQWANVTLEIQGHPAQDQKPVADDLSAYKSMSIQLYATGSEYVRIEFISHGQGIKLDAGFPQIPLKLKPGLNTYLIPLKNLQQPSWVQERVNTKDVLKGLTAVSISAYCNECTPLSGTIVVDNLVFQK
ncbi:MAG TPA: hypothetical protein VI306_23040 [Pyrinomonadaceae bacterium]